MYDRTRETNQGKGSYPAWGNRSHKGCGSLHKPTGRRLGFNNWDKSDTWGSWDKGADWGNVVKD